MRANQRRRHGEVWIESLVAGGTNLPPEVRDLVAEILRHCTGRFEWQVLNAADDGMCIRFDVEQDAHRWFDEKKRDAPAWIAKRIFSGAEVLALRAGVHLVGLASPAQRSEAYEPVLADQFRP